MNNGLILSYMRTIYRVFEPQIDIKIGEINPALTKLLSENNFDAWAYITPYNPYSKVLSQAENDIRFKQLNELLKGYPTYLGEGVGEDPNWLPEKSVLVLGITRSEASRIGSLFEQNAIVL